MFASLLGRDLPERLDRDARALGVPAPTDTVTEDQLAGLPATVQRYLRFMGVVGRPAVTSFRAHLRGDRGRMLGKLLGTVVVADGEGEPFDIGELTASPTQSSTSLPTAWS